MSMLFTLCVILTFLVAAFSFMGMVTTRCEEAPTSIFVCCIFCLLFMIVSGLSTQKQFELSAIKAGVAQYKVDNNGKVTFEFIQVKTKDIEKHEP